MEGNQGRAYTSMKIKMVHTGKCRKSQDYLLYKLEDKKTIATETYRIIHKKNQSYLHDLNDI